MGCLARAAFVLTISASLVGILTPGVTQASAIITNGTVTLGVNDEGDLNVTDVTLPGYPGASLGGTAAVGVRLNETNADGTAPGCLCEGWGVAIIDGPGAPFSGFVNRAFTLTPVVNLSLVSFTATESTATSIVIINDATGAPALEVTHAFGPSASPNLYRVEVTIRNVSVGPLGTGPTSLRYRRVMDWDIEPTASSEFVTFGGPAAANLLASSNNGFETANPLVNTPPATPDCTSTPTDCGPSDHGALFDFAFPALATGEARTFSIFYGAAPTEAGADEARLVAGVGPFSYGQCNPGEEVTVPALCDPLLGTPQTFVFGFADVGETVPPPATDGDPRLCGHNNKLEFGGVRVGQFKELAFRVENIGTGTLTGTAQIGEPFAIVAGIPFSVPGGQHALVMVRFSPTSAADVVGTVNITSNGGNASFSVKGTGVGPVADQEPPRQHPAAPVITTLTASPDVLWPADDRLVHVRVSVAAHDASGTELACRIVAVSPGNSGTTPHDWKITGKLAVKLKAERSRRGDGREYTVTVQCTNDAGGSSTRTVTVRVPRHHGNDHGKRHGKDHHQHRDQDKHHGWHQDDGQPDHNDHHKDRGAHDDRDHGKRRAASAQHR
jgi:type IV pilus assembly protein PilY1